jgi:hypothetical protein
MAAFVSAAKSDLSTDFSLNFLTLRLPKIACSSSIIPPVPSIFSDCHAYVKKDLASSRISVETPIRFREYLQDDCPMQYCESLTRLGVADGEDPGKAAESKAHKQGPFESRVQNTG